MNSVRRYVHLLLAEKPRLFTAVCAVVLLIILTAGFWPFNFYTENKVTWLHDRDGVRLYGQSMIISADSGQKQRSSPFHNKSISLELWLRPALEMGNAPSILTLYDGKSPAYTFKAILGIAVSLFIEISQAYLPTRDSSLVDVAMNSAGTIIGIVFFSRFQQNRELKKA
jgi:VanZ family protein